MYRLLPCSLSGLTEQIRGNRTEDVQPITYLVIKSRTSTYPYVEVSMVYGFNAITRGFNYITFNLELRFARTKGRVNTHDLLISQREV